MADQEKDRALAAAREAHEQRRAEIEGEHEAHADAVKARATEEGNARRSREQDHLAGIESAHEAASEAIEQRYREAMAAAERRYLAEVEAHDEVVAFFRERAGALVAPVDQLPAAAVADYPTVLRVGTVAFATPWSRHEDPVLVPFLTKGNLVVVRDDAVGFLHTLLVRLYAGIPHGKLLCTFVDPIGLAENVSPFLHLRDTAPRLIGHSVRTQPQEIEACLEDLIKHVQYVNEQLLRDSYRSLLLYNAEKKELAEPYRLVVILDFPANVERAALRHLRQVVQAGPRCGVNTIISAAEEGDVWAALGDDVKSRFSVLVGDRLRAYEAARDEFDEPEPFDVGPPVAREDLRAILQKVGTGARDQERSALRFDEIAPQRRARGTATCTDELRVPLGLQAPGRPQELRLGKETRHHVLIAGTTGSGKSNLVHVLIVNLTLTYAPGEVEFYLIDFKSGVELQPYARRPLPTAKVVAVDSEPEFGLSVLEGLRDEVERRMQLFGAHGVQDYAGFRTATGRQLARIVLVMDEFQRLFVDQDGIDYRAKRLLDDITRIGRAAGVHVILCTQTLSGKPLLSQSTIEQLSVRIALKVRTREESQLILAPGNHAASTLAGTGVAVYNPDGGSPERNEVFRIAHLTSEHRERCLDEIAGIWHGTPVSPPRVFAGKQYARLEANTTLREAFEGRLRSKRPHVVLGEPLAVAPPLAVHFERRAAQHLLIAGTDPDAAAGLVTAALLSLAAQPACSTVLLDLLGEPRVAGVASRLQRCRVRHASEILATLKDVACEVERRRAAPAADPRFLVLFGVQRATELSAPRIAARPAGEPTANDHLRAILDDGAPVGVHVILWCDTAGSYQRRVHSSADFFDDRVAVQMSSNDSHFFLGKTVASKLGDCQAIHWNSSRATGQKFFPYAVPEDEHVDLLLGRQPAPTGT